MKDRYGPWVRVKKSITECGIVKDWRDDPVVVQLGDNGPYETFFQDELELMTKLEFEDYIKNPLRADKWKSLGYIM